MKNAFKALSQRELTFCYYMKLFCNGKEAAIKAGYEDPEVVCVKLLAREDIVDKINSSAVDNALLSKVRAGYERLAFGSIADCIELIISENLTGEQIQKMDLFSISEIKYPKAGGFEIKFFDRSKALEKLLEIAVTDSSDDTAGDFLKALQNISDDPDNEV